ncbi:MAG: hypothetical protein ACR2MB_13290 [Acidimicrobiales bacterium]
MSEPGPPPLPGGDGPPPPPPPPPPPASRSTSVPPPFREETAEAGPPPWPDEAVTGEPPPLPGAPPAPDPGPLRATDGSSDLAAYQVTEATRTYPCRQCGDQLVFDITSQKLACPSCGFSADIDVSSLVAPTEHDLASAMTKLRAAMATSTAPQVTGEKEIVCQNCGGHTTFTGSLTATRCPYCATPIQRDDIGDAPARLPVDGVLPFRVDDKTAGAELEKWINSRWFAPSEFKKYKETGSFTSIYAAYFTYDADTSTWYAGQRGDDYTVTVGSGDNRHTETRTRWSSVSGQVANDFDDLAVLANDGFDHKRVKALEPWPTATAAPFSGEFVAGHLSRTYDRDAEACLPEARAEMDATINTTICRDIGGDHQRVSEARTTFHSLGFKHLLLPIWLLTVIFEGQPFQVFINGMTGEVQGQRPWSKVKIAAAIVAAIIVIVIVLVIYGSTKSKSGA